MGRDLHEVTQGSNKESNGIHVLLSPSLDKPILLFSLSELGWAAVEIPGLYYFVKIMANLPTVGKVNIR